MDNSGNQSSVQEPRELERLTCRSGTKRMIKLTNNTQFPYDAASYDQTRWTYPTIIENYKDKAHIPPLELVYAGIKKTLINIKKDSLCVRCAMKVGEGTTQGQSSRGVYFPLDKGIYLIPIPCCEGCFSRVQTVLVNGQICPIQHYSWKMIVCANLAEHYHRKILVEAEKVLENREEDPVINTINQHPTFDRYDFTTDLTLSEPSSDYQWIDIQEEVPIISFDTDKMKTTTKTSPSKIRMEWILSSILGPITCYIFYHLFHLFIHKNE